MRKVIAMAALISTLGVGLPMMYRTIHRRLFGVRSEVYLEGQIMEYYYPDEVRVIVEQMALANMRSPVNATLDKATGRSFPMKTAFILMWMPLLTRLSTPRPKASLEWKV